MQRMRITKTELTPVIHHTPLTKNRRADDHLQAIQFSSSWKSPPHGCDEQRERQQCLCRDTHIVETSTVNRFSRARRTFAGSFNLCHPTQTVAPGNCAYVFCLCRPVSSSRIQLFVFRARSLLRESMQKKNVSPVSRMCICDCAP